MCTKILCPSSLVNTSFFQFFQQHDTFAEIQHHGATIRVGCSQVRKFCPGYKYSRSLSTHIRCFPEHYVADIGASNDLNVGLHQRKIYTNKRTPWHDTFLSMFTIDSATTTTSIQFAFAVVHFVRDPQKSVRGHTFAPTNRDICTVGSHLLERCQARSRQDYRWKWRGRGGLPRDDYAVRNARLEWLVRTRSWSWYRDPNIETTWTGNDLRGSQGCSSWQSWDLGCQSLVYIAEP